MKKPNVPKKNQMFDSRTTVAAINILNLLSRYPNDSFSLTEIAKKVNVSKSTASRVLSELQKDDMIVIGQIANIWRVKFKASNLKALGYKIAINLGLVYSCGVIEYVLQKWGTPRSIILFGSVRKGEDGPNSDIDIAIEIAEQKEPQILSLEQFDDENAKKLKEFEKNYERHFKFYFFNREKVDPNLFVNIANGIVLLGLLEVKP